MIACPALVAIVLWIAPGWSSARGVQIVRVAMIVFTVALAGYLAYQKRREDQRYLLSVRNYYGVLRVYDSPDADEHTPARKLIHGTINHGSQLLDAKARDTATSYYGPKSGMGGAIRYFKTKRPLGAGSPAKIRCDRCGCFHQRRHPGSFAHARMLRGLLPATTAGRCSCSACVKSLSESGTSGGAERARFGQ